MSAKRADLKTLCRCGRKKAANKIVCLSCWRFAPPEVRADLNAGNKAEKRGAARQLLMIAFSRNPQTLQPEILSTLNSHPTVKRHD
jgi:hypothetical protein